MPPAGLLAIIAAGLILAYVLPQRIKERSDYALVRTEDRYSAQMRVVRATAQRVVPREAASHSSEVPLLVTGSARAAVAAVGASSMSRPHGPLDKAATEAERESLHLRSDRRGSVQHRAVRARRRAALAGVVAALAVVAWSLAAASVVSVAVAAVLTGAWLAVVVFSARAGAAERRALAEVRRVEREVEAAAAATRALRAVTAARARGDVAAPSPLATQAIRIVTATDLAPLSAPSLRRSAVERAEQAAEAARIAAEREAEERADAAAGWRPRTMPVPAYALKAQVRQQTPRPLSEEDYAASSHAEMRAAAAERRTEAAAQGGATLDQILARRRQASA